jgi:hypothetical protein
MPLPAIPTSRLRCALLTAALFIAPPQVSAQARADAGPRGELVVITAASVRVRTAPSIGSLSIDEFAQGSTFRLAGEEYQSADWHAVIVDGRIGYVPRFATALRARAATATTASAAPATQNVMQAGTPTPAPTRAPVAIAPAPATRLAAAPVPARSQVQIPVQPQVARSTPPAEPVIAERAPEVAPPIASSATAERAQPAAAEPAAEAPVFKPRRTGLNLTAGVLGSATLIETSGLPRAVHVSGASFIGVRFKMLGLYAAPDMGQGGGFRSTSLDGGASLDLIGLHLLRVTALGGYLRYSETTMPEDSTVVPVTRSLEGYTMGGMVSIPFVGPLRLAYRGQYDTVRDAGIPVHRVKHSIGFLF